MVHANEARIAYEAEMRKPLYSKAYLSKFNIRFNRV